MRQLNNRQNKSFLLKKKPVVWKPKPIRLKGRSKQPGSPAGPGKK